MNRDSTRVELLAIPLIVVIFGVSGVGRARPKDRNPAADK